MDIPRDEVCGADGTSDSVPLADDDGGADTGVPRFSISAMPQTVVVPQGGDVDVFVTILRADSFSQPVHVTVGGLPPGVLASELTIGADSTKGVLTLSASATIGIAAPDSARVRGRTAGGTTSALISVTVRGPPSSVDRSFGDDGYLQTMLSITDAVEQADGKLVFTGEEISPIAKVCRLEPNGTPDLSFGESGGCTTLDLDAEVRARRVAVKDGRIFLAGILADGSGMFVARLHADGSLDPAFGVRGSVRVSAPASLTPTAMLVEDKQVLLAGRSDQVPDAGAFIARLRANGEIDATFANDGLAFFGHFGRSDLVWRRNCRFAVIAGSRVHAFETDGKPDLTFGDDGRVDLPFEGATLVRSPQDSLIAGGRGVSAVRLSATGSIETVVGPLEAEPNGIWSSANAYDAALLSDGTMVFAGEVNLDSDIFSGIARLLADGSPDGDFGIGGAQPFHVASIAHDLEVLRDGRYVITGTDHGNTGVIVRVWN